VPSPITIRRLVAADVRVCERILRGLPGWFGIETSIIEYVDGLATHPAFVAVAGEEVIGFLVLKEHFPQASEVWVMAVDRHHHGKGAGRALMRAAEASLGERTAVLQVKTLGLSIPDEGYARTREFYLSMGFIPLEETTAIWGPDNPCLIMVKPLGVE
jgi:ribosomal protein S18 acetylase RimI-like enzyme